MESTGSRAGWNVIGRRPKHRRAITESLKIRRGGRVTTSSYGEKGQRRVTTSLASFGRCVGTNEGRRLRSAPFLHSANQIRLSVMALNEALCDYLCPAL